MKKTLVFLSLILLYACGSSEIELSETEIPDGIFYIKNSTKPFTGKCIVRYTENSAIKEIMNFKDGILDGERISYYKSGAVRIIGNYKNGMINGTWKSLNEKGVAIYEVNYVNDSIINKPASRVGLK